ncbi:hypothetical protein, partial [Dickeya dianthicola]
MKAALIKKPDDKNFPIKKNNSARIKINTIENKIAMLWLFIMNNNKPQPMTKNKSEIIGFIPKIIRVA